MQVKINNWVFERIKEYYRNAEKAHPTWDPTNTIKNVRMELKKVGSGQLQKSNQSLPKWKGCIVERSKTGWYFAYKVENGVIYVHGAEHNNNMSNNTFVSHSNQKTDGNYNPMKQFVTDNKSNRAPRLTERQFRQYIRYAVRREINQLFEDKIMMS